MVYEPTIRSPHRFKFGRYTVDPISPELIDSDYGVLVAPPSDLELHVLGSAHLVFRQGRCIRGDPGAVERFVSEAAEFCRSCEVPGYICSFLSAGAGVVPYAGIDRQEAGVAQRPGA